MPDFNQIAEDLKSDEGWEPSAYQDHLGFWTIGYGFLIDDRKGGQIPRRIAHLWLQYAIKDKWKDLITREPWVEEQPEEVQRALANMIYQMGVDGVLKFRNMLSALKEGNRERAALEALDSTWAAQTPQRAQRVAARIRG